MKINKFFGKTTHNYHLVTPSPWPLITSQCAFFTVVSGLSYMRNYNSALDFFYLALFALIFASGLWWRDVIRESTYEGNHLARVQAGMKLAFALFIASEVMFFFAFFWAFFHSSISAAVEIGAIWPPKGIILFDMKLIPFLNTLLLVSSGCTITWAHHSLTLGDKKNSVLGLHYTVLLAVLFTIGQAIEYVDAGFTISDSVFGSTFFMTTGFHGFHVFIGTLFLSVTLFRLINNEFTVEHHLGFELAAWYWHFVDVVWLWLFIFYYGWSA